VDKENVEIAWGKKSQAPFCKKLQRGPKAHAKFNLQGFPLDFILE
jgi:hypothetical protein